MPLSKRGDIHCLPQFQFHPYSATRVLMINIVSNGYWNDTRYYTFTSARFEAIKLGSMKES
eukprot:jgi/Psemu1/309937/fgenesh1_kg.570_\